jgi:hypothetical protein
MRCFSRDRVDQLAMKINRRSDLPANREKEIDRKTEAAQRRSATLSFERSLVGFIRATFSVFINLCQLPLMDEKTEKKKKKKKGKKMKSDNREFIGTRGEFARI